MARVRAARVNSRRWQAGDPLTGLPPRSVLEAYVAARVAEEPASGRGPAVVVLDIDGFHHVNAVLGYAAGDRMLVALARALVAAGPPLVTRLGADRFAVVVRAGAGEAARDAAAALATAARAAVARSFTQAFTQAERVMTGEPVRGVAGEPTAGHDAWGDAGVSVGMAVCPGHGRDATTLLRRAEQAMREARRRGDGGVGAPTGDGADADRLRRLADLRRAVCDPTDRSLKIYFQPQVDPRTGTVVGAEALPRWHVPGRSPLDPAELLRGVATAERAGVPRLLTTRVLDDVIGQLARWGDAVGDLRVSVNVTMHDLTSPDLLDRLVDRLAERNVPASRLQLEITEGALVSDGRAGLAALNRVHRLGIPIALDHFGTGTASLALLRRLPLAEVKIDRSFVLGAAADEADAAVVRAVVGLAADLGLRAVAEGVEDERTWRALARAGCVVQGWYCARPMPAERLVNWMALYRDRLRPQLT